MSNTIINYHSPALKRYQRNIFEEESKLDFDKYEGYKGLEEPIFTECLKFRDSAGALGKDKNQIIHSASPQDKRRESFDFWNQGLEFKKQKYR